MEIQDQSRQEWMAEDMFSLKETLVILLSGTITLVPLLLSISCGALLITWGLFDWLL